MSPRAQSILIVTIALALAGAATALAGPLKGKTYKGAIPSSGKSSRRHLVIPLHAGGNIVLRVSRSGGSVTVSFSSAHPVLYCNTPKLLQVQTTKAAKISSSGSFKASISQRFNPGPGLAPIMQVVSGRFSGGSVSGTIQTVQSECGGVTHFSAKAG
jgi:hypothetical protein